MGSKLSHHHSHDHDYTVFTDTQIDSLLNDTSFDQDQLIDWHMGFIEHCPNGKMNKDKFIKFYSILYPNGKAEKYCKQVFRVFDSNDTGEILFEHFIMAISITTMGDLKKKLLLAFKLYDLDKNEFVDKKEMEKVIESLYELLDCEKEVSETKRISHDLVNSIMLKFDKNDDHHLSKDEFVEGCLTDPVIQELLVPSNL